MLFVHIGFRITAQKHAKGQRIEADEALLVRAAESSGAAVFASSLEGRRLLALTDKLADAEMRGTLEPGTVNRVRQRQTFPEPTGLQKLPPVLQPEPLRGSEEPPQGSGREVPLRQPPKSGSARVG